ncbi:MAG TPA: cyclopropane-fatty-acyl-phospholipid synthase family protein [Methylocella sp.]|nr:cyclopropane-fatty-acyl-phospholipid synthase family protein [Methylocella sp.]
MAGELKVDGRIEDIIKNGILLAERLGGSTVPGRLASLARFFPARRSRAGNATDVCYHYDVSNDFYRLWLDENMVYSCAYFRTGSEDIDLAQRQKLDHICRKLLLRPGDRLLDIGCGWGGLLHWAAENYGITGLGITLSEQQCVYAREWMTRDKLDTKVKIKLQDYRELTGEERFDKIVSVGMYEHVGPRNYPAYFGTIAKLLKQEGVLLNHGIVATDPAGRSSGPVGGEFIDRYVFPGAALHHLSKTVFEIARAGLEIADIEDLRPHYARTLLNWVRRLDARPQEAIRTAGDQRYRIWRVYLAAMAYAFDCGWLSVAQVLAYKPIANGVAPRPWTRDYQYVKGAAAKIAGRLKWDAT